MHRKQLKRSAKYHWEYRVVVSVDDERQTLKRYDCRQPAVLPQATANPNFLIETTVQQFVYDLVTQ